MALLNFFFDKKEAAPKQEQPKAPTESSRKIQKIYALKATRKGNLGTASLLPQLQLKTLALLVRKSAILFDSLEAGKSTHLGLPDSKDMPCLTIMETLSWDSFPLCNTQIASALSDRICIFSTEMELKTLYNAMNFCL